MSDHPTIGATGDYPDAEKIRPDDQGGLNAAIYREGKWIIMEFGKPVSWLAITPADALALADKLRDFARREA